MLRLSATDAWRNIASRNPHSRWDGSPGERHWAFSARKRFADPIFLTSLQPSFTIDPSDSVFCIGSCFARNIEDTLAKANFTVLSLHNQPDVSVTFNKYNTFSMLNEARWALEPEAHPFPIDSLIEESGGFADPHLASAGPGSRDDVIARRERIIAYFAQLRQAKLVIVTLGLVEAWYDTKTGLYLNEAPNFVACRRNPDRFELRVIPYEDNRRALEELYGVLRRHADPAMRMIVTVSPVPFMATFTDRDVLVANTYSKSTLRAVATDFADGHERVDYFPSYECVINSSRDITWESDRIHVTDLVVSVNIMQFLAHYFEPERGARVKDLLEQAVRSLDPGAPPAGAGHAARPPQLDGVVDREHVFPAGAPEVVASSSLIPGLGPQRLVEGPEVPWVAATPVSYPQTLEFRFPAALRCTALWLQSQLRFGGYGPTLFMLEGGDDPESMRPLTLCSDVVWANPREWQRFALPEVASHRCFRLTMHAGNPQMLTLLRAWLEPAGFADAPAPASEPAAAR